MFNSISTFALFIFLLPVFADLHDNNIDKCNLPDTLKKEIASYDRMAEIIINATSHGRYKRFVYDQLAYFVDTFGNRVAGSQNLENAIDFMLEKLKLFELENVHGEEVSVPHWVRGEESVAMLQPRYQKMAVVGLFRSVQTPPEGIRAEALVVKSFEELKNQSEKAKGKIVVFNEDYVNYGESVKYRTNGAVQAASYGAVAVLIRSVTPFSMNTPHTGYQAYSDNITKIPTACITVEDANLLNRLQNRRQKIVLEIKMQSEDRPDAISRNTIAEIPGYLNPEKVVIVSGHLDSWDVGQGAMDDGGGAFIAWGALAILKDIIVKRPKRTIRSILWTAEEEGLVGAYAYAKAHKSESSNFTFIMESDIGTFTPLGLEYSGSTEGACILQEVLKLVKSINATALKQSSSVGSDITIWTGDGFPGASLLNQNEKYFWFHHTNADTMDVEDPDALDKAVALWAIVSYVIADLSIDFPRK